MQISPLPESEAARLAELQRYEILDTLPEEDFDTVTQLAAHICETPIALVSLIDAHRQWFKAKVGVAASETSRDIAFCAHAIHQSDVFVVPDAAQDNRFADNPLVTMDPNIRFYAGMPLITSTGMAMGTLCVIDRVPRQLTPFQQDALRTLGRQAVKLLELRRHIYERARMVEALKQNKERLELAIRGSQDGLWAWQILTNEVYLSPRWMAFRGYDDHELPLRFEERSSRIHPDDKDRVLRSMEEYLAQRTAYFKEEYRTRCKDGRYKWILDRGQAVWDDQGQPLRMSGTETDITDRKLAELALAEKTQELTDFIEEAPISLHWVGPDGTVLWANQHELDLLGYTREEYIGHHIAEFHEDQPTIQNILDRLNHNEILHHYPARLKSKDGTSKDVLIDSSVQWINGKFSHTRCFTHDITEEVQKGHAIQKQARLLEHIFAYSTDCIILLDINYNFIQVNRRYADICGRDISEFPGHNYFEDDPSSLKEEFDNALRQNVSYTKASHLFTCPKQPEWDGTYWNVNLTSIHGSIEDDTLLLLTLQNVSEHKHALNESEKRFLQIAETIPEVFWMTDLAKSEMLYCSPAYETVWGRSLQSLYASPSQWVSAIHSDDRDRVWQTMLATQHLGNYNEKYRIIRIDGEQRWIQERAYPIKDDNGQVCRLIGIAQDITDHMQTEAVLAETQEQVRQLQKMEALGQLAGGIAHDFNNLLTAILGYTDLVGTKLAADHPSRPHLSRIREAGNRASLLVKKILAFSHRQPFTRTVLSLTPVVNEAIALLRATLPVRIELTCSAIAGTPPVLADATAIHQVVINLCTNAWQALGQEKGAITVELATATLTQALRTSQTTLLPGRYAHLSVRDTGCGMAPETIARIFDPFFTTKPVGEGTGLGLSVVQGIVWEHDGAIAVDSQLGQGTTMHLYLPAAEVSAKKPEAVATPANKPGLLRHLIYLDDEAMLVELMREQLESLGYRVTGYTQPTEALDAIRADPGGVDAVVTDYSMPGLSGIEVAHTLSQLRADLPVVLVSGYLAPDVQAEAHAAGIRQILSKPILWQEVGDVIAHLLDAPPQT